MWMFVVISLGIIHTLNCNNMNSMAHYDSDKYSDDSDKENQDQYREIDKSKETETTTTEEQSTPTTPPNVQRRFWLVTSKFDVPSAHELPSDKDENEKDAHLKSKISTLVHQTLHDTERKLRFVQKLKERHSDEAPYKVGFILSMVKKSKDVINELFNVAVKHRDDWKALEQLKMFEFMVHTNVDTTNLVRQMVEIHIMHINSTNLVQHRRNRVVLLLYFTLKVPCIITLHVGILTIYVDSLLPYNIHITLM